MAITEPTFAGSHIDALSRIIETIESVSTLGEFLALTLQEMLHLTGFSRGVVVLLNDDTSLNGAWAEYPTQNGGFQVIGRSAAVQRALEFRTPVEALRTSDGDILHHVWNAYNIVALPLVAHGTNIGVLVLGSEHTRAFASEDMALLRVLTSPIASAVSAFRTREETRRRSEELSTVNEIATAVTSTLDSHEVYRQVVQKLNTYFKVDAGSILLLDEPTGDLEFVMTIEGNEERLTGVRVPPGQGVVGYVAQNCQSVIVHDVENDPRFYRKISEDVGYVTRSILCVPMVVQGHVIGVIELLNKLDGNFTDEDAERLSRMAAFIGVAIENARLFQQVADGRDQLAAILNSTAEGIVMTDMQDVILSANPMAAHVFGLEHQTGLLGRQLEPLLDDLHSRAHEVVQRPWGSADDSEERNVVTELELGGARRRFIRHQKLPVRDADGDVYAQLAVFHDVTNERELAQLRDDYTGMLVHDMRAPLTSIMNGIVMVQRGLCGPVNEPQNELLSIAHQGSQTMLELVNNLLDISKMEEGRMAIDIEPLVPYTLVDQAIERLDASARSRKVTIEQQLALGLDPIEADRDKLIRIIQNLLDNAMKFSPTGGVVTIGVHCYTSESPIPAGVPVHPPFQQGDWMIFWVQDRGPGIPAAYHERIFEKFGQVRGRRARGTGLGLTFCKLAVEAHHGRIWLESSEGNGSVFAFALPQHLSTDHLD